MNSLLPFLHVLKHSQPIFTAQVCSSCRSLVSCNLTSLLTPFITRRIIRTMQAPNEEASAASARPPSVLDVVLRNHVPNAAVFDAGMSGSESSSIVTQSKPSRSKLFVLFYILFLFSHLSFYSFQPPPANCLPKCTLSIRPKVIRLSVAFVSPNIHPGKA